MIKNPGLYLRSGGNNSFIFFVFFLSGYPYSSLCNLHVLTPPTPSPPPPKYIWYMKRVDPVYMFCSYVKGTTWERSTSKKCYSFPGFTWVSPWQKLTNRILWQKEQLVFFENLFFSLYIIFRAPESKNSVTKECHHLWKKISIPELTVWWYWYADSFFLFLWNIVKQM
jgi:hypothetical protein